MGLLIKKQITNKHDFHCDGLFIRMNKEPYLIGKVVKIQDKERATDYLALPSVYCKAQVKDFSIFIVEAGFSTRSTKPVSSEDKRNVLEKMCEWYRKHKIENNRSVTRLYKTEKP